MIKRHLSNRSNDIDHPSVSIEHSIEVVISHLVFYGLFVILSTIHSRQMISHNILHPLLIPNFNIDLLKKKKDPTDQSGFSIHLSQEILDGRVIGVNNDLRVHDVRPEFFEGEYHR
jgi:hypothetical protein